jgi:DNA-directed RNA polymerase subunit omega
MLPSPDILNEFALGKFVLSNLAAKRAKQLREGAPPLVQIESNHPLTIALAEIAAGKIKAIMPSAQDQAIIETAETMLIDETVPAELGMLLPALDETEAILVSSTAIAGEEDAEHEHDHDETEPISLSDLVEDEEEDAPLAPADDDTLSLSDIAEQETAEEEEAEQ